MGLLSILKKVRQMEREMRILMVYVPHPMPPPRAPAPRLPARLRAVLPEPSTSPSSKRARQSLTTSRRALRARAAAAMVTGAVWGAA